MAQAFDAFSDGGTAAAPPLSWTHTCTGSNRGLFVGVLGSTTDVITGATYAGVATTLVNKVQQPSGRFTYMFFLSNPASGANTVTVNGSGGDLWGVAASYTGVKQSDTVDSQVTNTGVSVTTITTTTTTVADNCWTVITGYATNNVMTAGAGTTKRGEHSAVKMPFMDSNAQITPAGSTSLVMTFASTNVSANMCSIAPPSVATTRLKALLGVGI